MTVRHDSAARERREKEPGLFALIGSLPTLFLNLVRAEIDQFKADMAEKAKRFGIGAGFIVVALFFLFFALGVFTAAAVLALALVLPAWASALIVGGVLLLIAVLLVLVGVRMFSGGPDVPGDTIDRIRDDIEIVRGADEYDDKRGTP